MCKQIKMAKKDKNIEVILPLHKFDEETKSLLVKALDSVPKEYNVIISTTQDVGTLIASDGDVTARKNVMVYPSEGESDFCSLVMAGVNAVDTPYFSILEYDDEYSPIWFKNVEQYIEYKPEVSVFLPLNDLVDIKDDTFIGYGNEAPWASSFSSEIGYIDNECLQTFFDFYLTGGVFNKDDFNNVGGLKPSIKLSFWYEFILRLTNKGKQIFVIPKIGYQHNVNREGSLFDVYRNTMDEKESKFWLSLAKRECFFKDDRKKTYDENAEEED